MEWIAKHATSDPVSVLDIGGRNLNGSPRRLFPAATRYTVLDIRPGEQVTDVDIIADAAEWNPGGQQWDVVICAETFEHTAQWPAIVRTAYKACRPGGAFIVTTAAPGRPTRLPPAPTARPPATVRRPQGRRRAMACISSVWSTHTRCGSRPGVKTPC